MSLLINSGVVFNALKSNPEFNKIGNEVIKRIQHLCLHSTIRFTQENGYSCLNFFNLFELKQKSVFKGFVSISEYDQLNNLIHNKSAHDLPSWDGQYLDSKNASAIKLPLKAYDKIYLPIAILHSLKHNDQSQIRNFLINAVLREVIQDLPELFCAPIRSLHWASTYQHYSEQLFKLKNTSDDDLPFVEFDTSELNVLCDKVEQAYVNGFLDPQIVDLFCFYNPDRNHKGNIHEQYVLFANTYSFAKDELHHLFKIDPLIYASALLYSNVDEQFDKLNFRHFNALNVYSQQMLHMALSLSKKNKKLLIRNLSKLLKSTDHIELHNLYLNCINLYPNLIASTDQLDLQDEFLQRSTHLHLLHNATFDLVLNKLDESAQPSSKQSDKHPTATAFQLNKYVKFWALEQYSELQNQASIEDLQLLSVLKENKICFDLNQLKHMPLLTFIQPYVEVLMNNQAHTAIDVKPNEKMEYCVPEFNFQNTDIQLELLNTDEKLKSRTNPSILTKTLLDQIYSRNKACFIVTVAERQSLLIVDTKTEGFKYLFDSTVQFDEKTQANNEMKLINIALQQINFG